MNNFYYLEEHKVARPQSIFLVFEQRQWTNSQAYETVLCWANYFVDLGVKQQEIVALDFMNGPAFVFAIFGLWAVGATPAFINYNLKGHPLEHCIEVSTAKYIIYDEEIEMNIDSIAEALNRSGIIKVCYRARSRETSSIQSIDEATILRQSRERPSDSLRSSAKALDAAVLIYTSGSTGLPKAAVVTWTKFSSGARASSGAMGITSSDRFYTCMPLYHGTATVLGLGTCLVTGATLVLGKKFSNKTFWPEVQDSRATIIQYVGEVCRYLMSVAPSNRDKDHCVRMAYGNGMRPDVWERFRERFGIETIAEFYASTEGVGGSFNYNTGPFGAGAVGRLGYLGRMSGNGTVLLKVDLDSGAEIRTPAGLCVACKPGEIGEVAYPIDTSNPQRSFSGYFNNKKASESKLIRNVLKKDDLYLRMGDLMSQDVDGFSFFHDRLGDTFRWKGENVSTTEVSEAIGSFAGIAETNVYGVQIPNHDGRVGCVAISLDHTAPLDLQALLAHLQNVLPKYAVPQFLRFVREMEVTGNHKHQKVALREQGVDPRKTGRDRICWIEHGRYSDFGPSEWQTLIAGSSRL